jgi:hypothetical protein
VSRIRSGAASRVPWMEARPEATAVAAVCPRGTWGGMPHHRAAADASAALARARRLNRLPAC